MLTGVINTYTGAVMETKRNKRGGMTTSFQPVSFTVGAAVVVPRPQPLSQPRQEGLKPTARAFVPKSLREVPKDPRSDISGNPSVSAWKEAVVWDMRKLAGLTATIPGLNGSLQINHDAIDEGVSEEEKRRRRALRARLFAPDLRFARHTAAILQIIRRVYAVEKADEIFKICCDFIEICEKVGVTEAEADRMTVNFDNLHEALQEVNQIESVIGALDL
jgi:hypothetical protein